MAALLVRRSQALATSMKKRKLIAVFFAFIVAIGIIWPSVRAIAPPLNRPQL